jgi:hypothetical protein
MNKDTQEFLYNSLHSIYETGFNDGRDRKVFLGSPSSVTEVQQAILQHFQQERESKLDWNDFVERAKKLGLDREVPTYTQSEVDRLIREATTRELEDLLEHEEPSPPGFRPCIRVDRVKERLWEIEELSKQKEGSK